ncbi:MAG: hypothetical protein GX241_03960 [Ruminococcaceae bacterium]|nr:hypothetical protein [Oscillospiraceae bacterium]
MTNFLMRILGLFMSIVIVFSMTLSPLTAAIIKSNYDYARSFDRVVYEDEKLVPVEDEDGWTFTTNGDFKIVQLTDIHIGGGSFSKTKDQKAMNAVAAMITAEKPDLVVITGDMAYPVPFQAGTFNNSFSSLMLIELLETLGVYYAVVFGNHDSEYYSTHDREAVAAMWGADHLQYSLFKKGPENVDGVGNYIIKVKNTDGITKNAFFLLDSHAYTDGDVLGIQWKYDNIKESQIEWYRQNVLAIDAANKAIKPEYPLFTSLAFFHIPLEEYGMAWNEFKNNGYNDTENVQHIDGRFNEKDEKSYCGIYPEQFFETMLELGSTKATFCGHDHLNNAILRYKGIYLVYGMSIDYLAYPGIDKQGAQRGCTVIKLNADGDLEKITLENYYQDKYVSKYPKETVTMQWDQ